MVDEGLVNDFIRRMREVVEAVRATNPDRWHLMQNYWIWPHEYPGPAARIAELADEVARLNPTMLDSDEVGPPLVFAILPAVIADEVDEEAFRTEAGDTLRRLITFSDTEELHIQLANLVLKSPLTFGPVEIHPIPNTGDTTEYNLKYKGPLGHGGPIDSIDSYAVIRKAPGMGTKAWRNAISRVEDVLTIFRAIGLPYLWGRMWLEAGVAGRGFASGWVILRRRAGQPWDMSLGSGGPNELMRLEQMLRNWSREEIGTLEEIYTNEQPTKMERKVLQAMLWLGEATLPASNSSKFAKLSIAFETAVGGEAKGDDQLREIGITEMLAERIAFLVGTNKDTRWAWHRLVKKLYGSRSRVMHGELDPISDDQLARWAFLVWNAVRAMLGQASEFRTVEQFARWVRQQRYTL